jgi:hypothetical protein
MGAAFLSLRACSRRSVLVGRGSGRAVMPYSFRLLLRLGRSLALPGEVSFDGLLREREPHCRALSASVRRLSVRAAGRALPARSKIHWSESRSVEYFRFLFPFPTVGDVVLSLLSDRKDAPMVVSISRLRVDGMET